MTATSPKNKASLDKQKSTNKKSIHIYAATLGSLFLLTFFIHWYRTLLPTPLTDAQAIKVDGFAGQHAYDEYLSRFVKPHSANTRENGVMRDFFGSVALDIQKEALDHGLKMDVIANDPAVDILPHDWFSPNERWLVESRNVIVRLHGQSGNEDAILLNAHYDSVPTSNGVTDDGMAVVTLLELMRYFVRHPPRQTIIFLINNFEEGGLIGARAFMNHPWYPTVKLFINLEGAGAGGRALLFRCTNLDAVQKIGKSGAGYVHASAIGNDMFSAQLIKSDTDYSVFVKDNIPGIDIAFYSPRSYYHTHRDNLENTSPEALQYMGQYALEAVKAIANSDDMLKTEKKHEAFVYYDILGRIMLVYSFSTYQVTNIASILIVVVGSYLLTISSNKGKDIGALIKQRVCQTIYGLFATIFAFVCIFVSSLSAAFVMIKINPSMTYGDVYGAALYVFSAGFFGLQFSQLVLPQKFKRVLYTTDASWYGLITFWAIMVSLSIYAGFKNVASLYFNVYLLAFAFIAAVLNNVIPSTFKMRSAIIFFVQTLVPFVLLMEIELLAMDAMRHSTADGTPEIAVYILLALPLGLTTLQFVPWIYVAENTRNATMVSAGAFAFLFSICSALQPFNGSWSPNKLLMKQEYNATEALVTVTISTATGLYSALKAALPAREFDTVECGPFKKHLTRCTYQTDLVPKYAGNETLNEFVLSEVEKTCDGTTCIASATYSSKNSLLCRVYFDPATNSEPISHAWINDREIKENNISALFSYINDYERPVNVKVEYPEGKSPEATFSCYYDEWTEREIPAFSYLRENLPENSILLIRGQGLVLANYARVSL